MKMREVRSGARGEGGGRRKEDKMGSQWVGGCVGAWMGKRERKRQSESESENQVFMKSPPRYHDACYEKVWYYARYHDARYACRR